MKKIVAVLLALCLTLALPIPAYAATVVAAEEASIRQQVDLLISSVDEEKLRADALANVVDDSVPASIRNSVVADASFLPADTLSRESAREIPMNVSTTVQKVGEVYQRSGDALNLYVAVAAASPKEDWDYEFDKGIKAWAFVYWIDNSGTNNELYGAAGQWNAQGLVLDNRQVWYGQTDIFFSSWVNGVTIQFPMDDYEYYEDPGVYYGFVLGCQTRVDVVNVGTVKCSVTSGLLT